MLTDRNGETFTSSWQRYLEEVPGYEGDRRVWIMIQNPGDPSVELLVMVDSGASWSVFGPEEWARLDLPAHQPVGSLRVSTRLGTFLMDMHRVDLGIRPDRGPLVVIEATIGLAPGWNGPAVIGYSGFLDRLRFAVDPTRGEFHFAATP